MSSARSSTTTGLARGHDLAAQALPALEPRPGHHAAAGLGPGADHQIVAFQQAEAGGFRADEPGGLVDDDRQHFLGIVNGGQPARHVVEHLEPMPVALRLLVEPGVAQEQPDLLADVFEPAQLALRKAACAVVHHTR